MELNTQTEGAGMSRTEGGRELENYADGGQGEDCPGFRNPLS